MTADDIPTEDKQQMKRVIMTTVGVLTCGFSAGMFDFAAFGMDPFQVFAHGIWNWTTLEFGTLYTLMNLVMLSIIFVVDRHKIGLGTLINVFLLGYVVQFSSWLWKGLFPEASMMVRVVFLIAAILMMCLASSLYYTSNLGVSTYDAAALIISEKKKWKFRYCRISTDLICVLIGFLLGSVVGAGTLVTAFFMGPLIDVFSRRVAAVLLYGKREG